MRAACDRSTACFASLKGGSGRWRIRPASISIAALTIGAAAAPRAAPSARNAPIWQVIEVRRRAAGRDVGAQLALEHRPDIDRAVAVFPEAVTSGISARPSRAASAGAKSRV